MVTHIKIKQASVHHYLSNSFFIYLMDKDNLRLKIRNGIFFGKNNKKKSTKEPMICDIKQKPCKNWRPPSQSELIPH